MTDLGLFTGASSNGLLARQGSLPSWAAAPLLLLGSAGIACIQLLIWRAGRALEHAVEATGGTIRVCCRPEGRHHGPAATLYRCLFRRNRIGENGLYRWRADRWRSCRSKIKRPFQIVTLPSRVCARSRISYRVRVCRIARTVFALASTYMVAGGVRSEWMADSSEVAPTARCDSVTTTFHSLRFGTDPAPTQ